MLPSIEVGPSFHRIGREPSARATDVRPTQRRGNATADDESSYHTAKSGVLLPWL
jgi:hypothetical protein